VLKYPLGFVVGDEVFPFISDFAPLVDALEAVHRRWLHNDVAPANIFFSKVPNDKLMVFLNDFGSTTNSIIPKHHTALLRFKRF
jgi:serine/threonine protein kinase